MADALERRWALPLSIARAVRPCQSSRQFDGAGRIDERKRLVRLLPAPWLHEPMARPGSVNDKKGPVNDGGKRESIGTEPCRP
ncbi:hypothetical protein ACIQCF_31275 [Streptomyces sp. NPDC088353]|uniref:hypothetical protein n=1 Tax=Streptomyces sp. NPDC088353 TaxID=3365855 RepID=UPI0037F774B9